MQLGFKKSAISSIFLWGTISLIAIGFIISLFTSKMSALNILAFIIPLLLITSLCILNVLNLISLYREFVSVTDDVVTINRGLIFKAKSFPLSKVSSVKYNRYNMTFKFTDEKPIKIDLYYISPKQTNLFIQYLLSRKVAVE